LALVLLNWMFCRCCYTELINDTRKVEMYAWKVEFV